jgi:hypothetical protein
MKRPLTIVTFALAALLSPSMYGGVRRSQISAVSSIDAEYQKIFVLGQQAAEIAARVGITQLTLGNDKVKQAYQQKAAHACVRGTADALESFDVDALLQEQNLGWFQRKYVETKVGEIIDKLRNLPTPSLNKKYLAPMHQEVLRVSYQFGEHAIRQSVAAALNLGVSADEQKRKEFGKRFATEFTAGVESALRLLDIKAIAEKHRIALTDNQVELVKDNMHKHIKRMRETIESGALGEFLAVQE